MNFRTTLILLVVLAGLGAFMIVATRDSGDTKPPESTTDGDVTKGRKLFADVKADDVDKLVIRPGAGSPAGAKTVELTKSAGKWNLAQPVSWPADSFDARGLVDSFVNLKTHGKVDLTSETRTSSGMDKPRYEVELTDKDGKTTKISVGNRFALGNDLYVSTDGGKSAEMVGGGTLSDKLDNGTAKLSESLRDKQIVRFTSNDVKQIEVTRGGKQLLLNKVGEDWKVVSPQQVPADSTEVSDLVSAVAGLRADEFVDPSAADVGRAEFDKPRAVVWVSTAAPATQPTTGPATAPATGPARGGVTITIGQPTDVEMDKAYVRVSDSGVVAKASLSESSFDKIAKATPLSLRDRRVVNIDPTKVSEFTLELDRPAATQPSTRPAEHRVLRVERRKENLTLGPALPAMTPGGPGTPATNPTTGPATEPVAPAVGPSTEPATRPSGGARPTTGPVGAADRLDFPSPLMALVGAVTATDPATQPAVPVATQPALVATPATAPSVELPPATQPTTGPATQPATGPATGPATAPAVRAGPPAPPPPPPSKWVIASEASTSADDDQVRDLLDALHPLKVEKYLETAPTTQPSADYVLTVKTVGAGGAETAAFQLHITDPGGEAKLIAHYSDLTFELDRSILRKLDGDFKTKRAPDPTPTAPPFGGGGGFHGGIPGM